MEILRKICGAILKPICHLAALIIYRVKIEGIENVPKNSACIICGNHIHAMDAPVLLATINRPLCFMAKEELWKNPGFRFLAFIYNVFPVKRGKNDTDAVKASIRILKSNKILGMYPEGTRNGLERGIKPKNGAVNLAIRTNSPIIPFATIGDFKPFKRVIYRFGKPIEYSQYKDKAKEKEFVDGLTKDLMTEIVKLRENTNAIL